MNASQEADINKTDGEIFHAGRKEALSFGGRPPHGDPNGVAAAPAPVQANAGRRDEPVSQARTQGASESMQQRPSARDKDMNVILESLNETQSQLYD